MNKKVDQINITLLFLLLCVGLNWAGLGHAFEAWNGEVTRNVHVRKSPGLKGNIFTGLKKGNKLLIIDRHKGWYQIAVETDSYGYKGWVFGKYLKRLEREEEGLSLEKERKPGSLVPSQEKISQDTNSPELIKGEKREAQEEKGYETPSSVTQIVLQSETNEKGPSKRPDQSLQSVSPQLSPTEARVGAKGESQKAEHRVDYINFQGINPFMGLVLILSSIIFSLLALLSSYRASNLARISSDVAKQLRRLQRSIGTNLRGVDEKRQHKRTDGGVEVDFVIEGQAHWGFISNISAGGAFIETRDSFPIGKELTLCYPSPSDTGQMKITGEIVRIDPKGIGVKFKADHKTEKPDK